MFFDLIAAFTIGLVGSVHCLGMCGPLVVAYSLHFKSSDDSPVRSGLSHHVCFHSGRVMTYALLGAAGAGLFQLAGTHSFLSNLRGGMVLLGGVLMIYLGLVFLKLASLPSGLSVLSAGPGPSLGRLIGSGLRPLRSSSRVVLGIAAGFLPCGLSWAMIVKAALTQSVWEAFFLMAAFGLGTAPLLLLAGFSSSYLSLRVRILGERVAGAAIIAMGLMLVFKGVRFLA